MVSYSESRAPWRIPEMNRELVESATRPDTLRGLVDELGSDWRTHGLYVEGSRLADNLTATDAVVRRDLSFLGKGVRFPDIEQRVRTRLSNEGIEVKFDPVPLSPFDAATRIPQLAIPGHLTMGLARCKPCPRTCVNDVPGLHA